jgi:ubiquinone/menaquinone biosynthesis C-methylase UbiE
MNGFHAFPDKEKAYYETYRVLKKGGLFCGCFYIKNQNRKTDWLVKTVLPKRGWFTPPFATLDELKSKLDSMYATVSLEKEQSVAFFCCKKQS